jgi:TRAP-type C4-dicarboxylate transport system substrate-binding protein
MIGDARFAHRQLLLDCAVDVVALSAGDIRISRLNEWGTEMRFRWSGKLAAIAALSLVAVTGGSNAADYDLTIGVAHPNTQTFVKLLETVFIPSVDAGMAAAGKGDKVRWTTGFGGTIVKFESLLEGVQTGLVDITASPVVMRPSELPMSLFTYNAPFGSTDVNVTLAITKALYAEFPQLSAQWAKFGQQPLAHYIYANHQIISKKPIIKFEDLKGIKVGAAGAVGNFFAGTGATPVNGNFTTYYNGLHTGVVDAAAGPVPAMYQARLYEVAKHLTRVDFGTQYVASITMNTAKLKSLPPYVQDVVREAAAKYQAALIAAEARESQEAIDAMKAAGVEVHEFPAAERAKWAAALPDLAGDWAARVEKAGMPGQALLQSYIAKLKAQGVVLARDWSAPAK